MANNKSLSYDKADVFFSRYWALIILLLILFLAFFLRFVEFGKAPPGLNQDEAVNAWNAYCLLKTGKDQVGVRWPIFYVRGIGGNWSPLYIYLLMPFQMIGGLSVATTRVPSVVFGVLNIALIYFVGKRLIDAKTGIIAALLLTVNPWHFQQCRWGHEESISALLGLMPLVLMLWADMVPTGQNAPRPLAAGVAGLLSGICCYGYQSVRVFVPVFLFLVILLNLPKWVQSIKKPKHLISYVMFIIAFAAVFTPLAWQHIFHPEGINRHFLFRPERFGAVGLYESFHNTFVRYFQHFSSNFLFAPVDYLSPPDASLFQWYILPLLLAGLVTLIAKFTSSVSARIILAFVLAYPVGDCLVWESNLSSFRSFAGLCGLILMASLGTVQVIGWLWKRYKVFTVVSTGALIIAMLISNVFYFRSFFKYFSNDKEVYYKFHTGLIEACQWLKPRFDDFDAVIFPPIGITHILAVVSLGYDPDRWFSEPREFQTIGEWDFYTRCGKMYFTPDAFSRGKSRTGHILLIVKPGTVPIAGIENRIVHKIIGPAGEETLWLCVF